MDGRTTYPNPSPVFPFLSIQLHGWYILMRMEHVND